MRYLVVVTRTNRIEISVQAKSFIGLQGASNGKPFSLSTICKVATNYEPMDSIP